MMSSDEQNKKYETLSSDVLNTENLRSTRDDEVIYVGGDLIPDDIDMYPRNLGSREMHFRQLWAEDIFGSIDPIDERDSIGSRMPFMHINAKTIFGNLQGTVNGMQVPGFIHGYGWILLYAFCRGEKPEIQVQGAFWGSRFYALNAASDDSSEVILYPSAPYMPFTEGSPVMVEVVRNNVTGGNSVTEHLSLIPRMNVALKVPQIAVPVAVPGNVSGQFQILIRLY